MADIRHKRMILSEKLNRHLKEKKCISEDVDTTLQHPRIWIKTFLMLDGLLIWSIYAHLHHGLFWLVGALIICCCLITVMPLIYIFQRLNMSLVVHHGWIRRQIRFKAEIDQLLQEVKDDMTESPAKKECQEHLEALVYLTAKTLEPKMLLYCKFRYAWAVIQSFVVGVLVPLVCFYILSRS